MATKLERPSDRVIEQRRVSSSTINSDKRRSSNDAEDDDAELEELVEQSVRRFIGIGASQSAHANLALMANGTKPGQPAPKTLTRQENHSSGDEEEDEVDSDEEFYVHSALLPFRKSKSTAFGFMHATKPTSLVTTGIETGNESSGMKRKKPNMLYANRNAAESPDNIHDMPLLGTPKLTSLNMIWPEPDTDYHHNRQESTYPTVNLCRGDVLTVQTDVPKDQVDLGVTESCWSAPTHLVSPSPSTSSSISSDLLDENESDKESEEIGLRPRIERLSRSWSAPSSLFEQIYCEEANADDTAFCIRPLNGKKATVCRSFSTDFLLERNRHKRHHRMWSQSCYALSAADEQEEDRYVNSEESVDSDHESEEINHQSEDNHDSLLSDEEDQELNKSDNELDVENMSISEEERMSVSDINENAESDIDNSDDHLDEDREAEDQLDEDLGDFSARRRSQLFIYKRLPQSKSDGHLLANVVPPQKRPRTPCFDESLNDTPMGFIRHSATYSGQFPTPNLKMSSGRSFIERLKERQRSKDEAKRRHSIKEVDLPTDLVESFDIDYEHKSGEDQLENLDGTWLNNDKQIEEQNKQNESLIRTLIDKPPLPPQICTSESVFNRLSLQNDMPERPDSLPNHWKLSKSEKLMATPTTNNVGATPMETPYEHQANLCDLTTGSNESDEQQMAGRSAYLYYATAHVDDTDPDNIPMADDDSLPPCSLTEIVQQSRRRVKPALRRRSPPIASEDELTDSEISELERQLANRHSNDDLNKQDSQETDEMPSQACQSPDVQLYYCRQPRQFLPGSASMPSFAINCAKPPRPLQVERAENGRSQLEETAQWLRKSKTQNFNQPGEDTNEEQNLVQNTFLSGSRRRILPMRPDEVANQGLPPQKPVVHPVQPQQRRLPTLPQSPTEQFAYSGMSAKMASPTSNGYVKSQQQPTRNEQIVHPLLSKHTQPPPQGSLPPKGTIASQLGHTHDYQLSYGIESSLVRSTTNYGLEDSYYEDGLNGNATHFPHRRTHNPYANQEDSSGISSLVSSDPTNSGSGPTHRAQFTFVPRHDDEILLEIGDPMKVEREYEDHWCFGVNLRTGHQGIFPSAHLFPVDPIDEITSNVLPANIKPRMVERDTFYLTLLASIEVAHHKGNDVLVQAINKVCELYQSKEEILVPQTVLMEVSFRGIHVIDKMRKDIFRCPTFDYFYSLQNISFCGAHPKQLRYFGFITKHPLLPRFACHVFLSNESTQPIVESIGRAFKRSYDEYMAFQHPTEDIYIE